MSKVSVIITAYNSMPYLPQALESVLNQSFQDFEVIIIDDGSTDNSMHWANEQADTRIRVISQKNQGVASARNNGIENSQGEYIAFLDGDDVWEETKLEKQVSKLDSHHKACLVHTWMAAIDEGGEFTGKVYSSKACGDVWHEILEKNMVTTSCTMIRRSALNKIGVFDQSLTVSEDWDLWIRCAAEFEFAVIEEPLVRYRQLESSKSKRYPKMLNDFRIIIEKAFSSVPFELLYLRSRSYGNIHLVLAWKCIQGKDKDYETAAKFCEQALNHYPQLRYTREYLRLRVAIAMMQYMGQNSYDQLLLIFHKIRRQASISL